MSLEARASMNIEREREREMRDRVLLTNRLNLLYPVIDGLAGVGTHPGPNEKYLCYVSLKLQKFVCVILEIK